MQTLSRESNLHADRLKLKRELSQLQDEIAGARATLAALRGDIGSAEAAAEKISSLLQMVEHLQADVERANAAAAQACEELQQTSQFGELDALTSVPNRLVLMDRLKHGVAAARRTGAKLAVLFLDLDRFKEINDQHGHALGDQVLKCVAMTLVRAVRQADTVCRLGGDEFVVLLSEVADVEAARVTAKKILYAIGQQCRVGGHVFHLAASIGISIFPDDGVTADELLARSDEAMYRVKRTGKGGFSV